MGSRFRNWQFLHRDDSSEHERSAVFASGKLDRWLADPQHRADAIRLYERLTGRESANLSQLSLRELHRFVKPRIDRALQSGELRVVLHPGLPPAPEVKNAWMAVDVEEAEEAPPPEKQETKARQTTWIEIELVDMKDKGLGGQRYTLKLSDGRTLEGRTGSDGRSRLEDIEQPGQVEISFPDLDQDAWEPA